MSVDSQEQNGKERCSSPVLGVRYRTFECTMGCTHLEPFYQHLKLLFQLLVLLRLPKIVRKRNGVYTNYLPIPRPPLWNPSRVLKIPRS